MADPRNIAHDKTVALDKQHAGKPVVADAAQTVQPGKKPTLQHHAKDEKAPTDAHAAKADHGKPDDKPTPDHAKD